MVPNLKIKSYGHYNKTLKELSTNDTNRLIEPHIYLHTNSYGIYKSQHTDLVIYTDMKGTSYPSNDEINDKCEIITMVKFVH